LIFGRTAQIRGETVRIRVRDDVGVTFTADGFVTLVMARVPEAEATVREHTDDDELLPHLLVADLRRLAIRWWREGRNEPLERLVRVIEVGLREGDEQVENAVAVSFVEDTGWWEESTQPFIARWHAGLAEELERQRRASS
jgi:hypothetical protein